jgi:hypothetical protein
MNIADGTAEQHPTPLPYDPAESPALANLTAASPSGTMQGGVCDTVGQQAERLTGYAADIAAAQLAGMGAELGRRDGLHSDMLPVGAAYGTAMVLPEVPEYSTPAASSFLFPWQGDEPTPAG